MFYLEEISAAAVSTFNVKVGKRETQRALVLVLDRPSVLIWYDWYDTHGSPKSFLHLHFAPLG